MKGQRYILAVGSKTLETSNARWPYQIDFDTGRPDTPFVLFEGWGYNAGGGHFNHKTLVDGNWDHFFEHTESEWLKRLITAELETETISFVIICDRYESLFGEKPRINDVV